MSKSGGTLLTILGQPDPEKAKARNIKTVSDKPPLPYRQLLETTADLVAKGQIKAFVGKTFPLSQARQAHELSQTGHVTGRIILHPQNQ